MSNADITDGHILSVDAKVTCPQNTDMCLLSFPSRVSDLSQTAKVLMYEIIHHLIFKESKACAKFSQKDKVDFSSDQCGNSNIERIVLKP